MKIDKRIIGFFSGILVFIVIMLLPLQGLSQQGKEALALTLLTVVWWATSVAQSGYVGGFYLVVACLLKLADTKTIFSGWTGSTIWLIIGAYLIASAVKSSGLGERISYAYILKFVRSWKSIIVGIFVLTFILSLLIPHPWPRAFLIMTVMAVVMKAAKMPKEDCIKIGFTVFASSVPIDLIFLTGDSAINPLAASYCTTESITFGRWFVIMGPIGILYSVLTLILILILFKPSQTVQIDFDEVRAAQAKLGQMTTKEKRTLVWVVIAIVLWLTQGITGLDIGWITLGIAILMSLPVVGEVIDVKDWSAVPVHVLVFITSAIAIGTVGGATGMNKWVASTLLPSALPSNIIVLALLIALITFIIHMFMGSVIAVMGVAIPSLLAATTASGIGQMAIIGIAYLVIAGHYILPFQNLTMLVGQGEENGLYSEKECIRMGVPLLIPLTISVIAAALWFKVLGLF